MQRQYKNSAEYWKHKLADMTVPNVLGAAKFAIAGEENESGSDAEKQPLAHQTCATYDFKFDIAPQNQTTSLEALCLSSFLVLLKFYTSESDLTIGFAQHDSKTIPLRMHVSNEHSCLQLATAASHTFLEGCKHPLDLTEILNTLPEHLKSAFKAKTAPFDISFSIGHAQNTGEFAPGLFALEVVVNKTHVSGKITYQTSVFNLAYIKSMLQHFKNIFCAVLAKPNILPGDISILENAEIEGIEQYNNTDGEPVYAGKNVAEILHEVAQTIPNQDALVIHPPGEKPEKAVRLTYQALDDQATVLACYLQQVCHQPEGARIGISLNNPADFFVALLAVMRAGMVIVTLGTNPAKDVRNLFNYKVDNSDISLYLVDDSTKALLAHKSPDSLLNLDHAATKEKLQSIHQQLNTEDPARRLTFTTPAYDPKKIVYIMYSSGSSTGEPKGIAISHEGMLNLLNDHARKGLQPDNMFPQHKGIMVVSSVEFDAVIYDFLLWLALRLVMHRLTEQERLSSDKTAEVIQQNEIHYGIFLANFLAKLPPDLPSLRYRISMGEQPQRSTFSKIQKINPEATVVDAYGPTECTICTIDKPMRKGAMTPGFFGQPVLNTKVYILTPDDLSLCAYNVPGELFITGPGVGEYLKPELNIGKFMHLKRVSDNKFSVCAANDDGAKRFFRTGDFGRYVRDENGNTGIEYFSRKDRTLKINGVQVNLDGLTKQLMEHEKVKILVKEMAIIPVRDKQNNNNITSLMGFVVLQDDIEMEDEEINEKLHKYMQSLPLQPIAAPIFISTLRLPITLTNRKIDFRAMEGFAADTSIEDKHKDPVSSDLLHLIPFLKKLWADILGMKEDQIDEKASFQELGGSSASILRTEGEINRKLKLKGDYAIRFGFGNHNLSFDSTIESLSETLAKKMNLRLVR